MTAEIHKNKLYLKPKPKKDVKEGLYLFLSNGKDMATDIVANKKKYSLPNLPEGVWIVAAVVKKA